jgi:hypothetical protein
MENTYATIKLQVLPKLLTPASTRTNVPYSIFETHLFGKILEIFQHIGIFSLFWKFSVNGNFPAM